MQNADLLNMAYMFGEQVKVETAGSLFNGRKVFALLQGETLNIKGDEVVQYLALMNGHDGKLSLSAMPTSVRIVCNNTLNMALRADSKKMFKVRHSTNMEQRMKDIASALKVFQETGSSFHKAIERMSESEIKNQAQLDRFWRAVYNHNFLRLGGDQEQKIKIAQASVVDADINTLLESVLSDDQISARRAVFENWQTTMDIESMQIGQNPNMWLAANAITGWHQKSEPGKKMEGWEERNLVSTCFGDKDDMSAEVMQTALAMG
jgi:phage/plasmid-like protein (TIGR03299 family)